MTRSRLVALGLCAVVLGLMTISASATQASQWLILTLKNEVKTGAQLPPLLAGEFEEKTDGTLLTTILGIKTEILCTAFALANTKAEGEGKISSGFDARFTGCTMKLNGELNKECEPHSEGSVVGTILTVGLKSQLKLIGTFGLIKIEPQTGSTLATIETGASCPIGNKIPINGVLTIEDCENLLETHLIKHLFKENVSSTAITAAGKKATLDGSAWVSLTGEHAGLAWGGDKE